MPTQEEHDRPENLVEPADLPVKPARSLEEEANSNNTLEGYAAINHPSNDEFEQEVEKLEEDNRAKAAQKGNKS